MEQIITDKKVLENNRERLIKKHLEKTGKVIRSKVPSQEWYNNFDQIFKKGH